MESVITLGRLKLRLLGGHPIEYQFKLEAQAHVKQALVLHY
jgi:hypothetical protein